MRALAVPVSTSKSFMASLSMGRLGGLSTTSRARTIGIGIGTGIRSSSIIGEQQKLSYCGAPLLARRLSPSPSPSPSPSHSSVPPTRTLLMESMASASSQQTASEKEESDFWEKVTVHQKTAAKLSTIESARTVLDRTLNAYLSTISKKYEGFPYGSYIDIAADEDGDIIVVASSLSPHTKDLEETPKCSLMIMKDKLDRSDTIVTYLGEASMVSDSERKKVRELYLSKHPNAFWVDFGDFKFFRIKPKQVRFAFGIVTPFNETGEFPGEDFKNAKVDPISQFSAPIAEHMNKDHADDTRLIVEKAIGVRVDHGKIVDLDRFGLNVQVGLKGDLIKLRVPFPRPAESRKDVKTLILELLNGMAS